MAISQSDLDALDAAIASGTLEVRFEDRLVKYQTSTEMLRARDHIAEVLRANSTTARRSAYRFTFTTSRGD